MKNNNAQCEGGIQVRYRHSISPTALKKVKFFVTPGTLKDALGKNRLNFDVIHLHEYRTFQNIFLSLGAKIYSVPYLVQAHGAIPKNIGPGTLKLAYDTLLGSRILRRASRVVAVSQVEADQYRQIHVPDAKIVVIPNGVDVSEFKSLPPRGSFREKHGIGQNERVILFLGRIHQIKGLDLLLHAFARAIPRLSETRLVIIGPDDGYLAKLMFTIGNSKPLGRRTLVLPALQNVEKLEAFVDADVYVLPSKYDAFPLSLLEAIACGAPVIVTEGCGLAEDCRDKVGLVVKGNETELSEALIRVISEEDLREKFRSNTSDWIKNYDVKSVASRLEEVYYQVISA